MRMLSLRSFLFAKCILLLVLFLLWGLGLVGAGTGCVDGATGGLHSRNVRAHALFGAAIALSRDGRVMVVGADLAAATGGGVGREGGVPAAGMAYVFERNGVCWVETAQLKAPLPVAGAGFGFTVALSDDAQTIAVGAPFEPHAGVGAVHLFQRTGDQWSARAHLRAPAGVQRFGLALGLSEAGTDLVAAALGERHEAQAHVFRWRAGRWSAVDVLAQAVGGVAAKAVPRVALSGQGKRIAIGSAAHGLVQVFDAAEGGWLESARWHADVQATATDAPQGVFALGFSADGRTLALASAAGHIDMLVEDEAHAWAVQAHLMAAPGAPALGPSLALSADGHELAINAVGDMPWVYRFRRQQGRWQAMPVLAFGGDTREGIGSALALSGDGRWLAVGARFAPADAGWLRPRAVPAAGAVRLYAPA